MTRIRRGGRRKVWQGVIKGNINTDKMKSKRGRITLVPFLSARIPEEDTLNCPSVKKFVAAKIEGLDITVTIENSERYTVEGTTKE